MKCVRKRKDREREKTCSGVIQNKIILLFIKNTKNTLRGVENTKAFVRISIKNIYMCVQQTF